MRATDPAARNQYDEQTKFPDRRRRHHRRRGSRFGQQVALAALPEPVLQTRPDTMPPLVPGSGRPYNPVVTLNGWTLPWRMNNGVKEFHLVAEPVVREMTPGFKAHLWGYNGQSPGPDHRSRGRRPGAHLRDQQAAGTHQHPLARPAHSRTAWTASAA